MNIISPEVSSNLAIVILTGLYVECFFHVSCFSGTGWTRTNDARLFRAALYQLSYSTKVEGCYPLRVKLQIMPMNAHRRELQ